jgi:hypothetical protein
LAVACEIKEIKKLGKTALAYDAQEMPQIDRGIQEKAYLWMVSS